MTAAAPAFPPRRFLDEPSAPDLAAVRALSATEFPERCFAAAVSSKYEAGAVQWMRKDGLQPRPRPSCACPVLRRRCRGGPKCIGSPPAADHPELWSSATMSVYVFSPYGLDAASTGELTDWCRAHGLEWSVSEFSPYFPSASLRVFVSAQKDEFLLPRFKV